MNIFQKIRAYLQLREAVRMADNAHAKDGGRYYVMPTTGSHNGNPRLVVMDRRNFRKLKHKGYIPTRATIRNLVSESFYFTPYINGDGFITTDFQRRKVSQFYSWYEAELNAVRHNRKRLMNAK